MKANTVRRPPSIESNLQSKIRGLGSQQHNVVSGMAHRNDSASNYSLSLPLSNLREAADCKTVRSRSSLPHSPFTLRSRNRKSSSSVSELIKFGGPKALSPPKRSIHFGKSFCFESNEFSCERATVCTSN